MSHNPSNKDLVILLAGSTGYIGEALKTELLDRNITVICPIRKSENGLRNQSYSRRLKIEMVDICSSSDVKKLARKYKVIDIIISCIGSRNGSKKEATEVEYNANKNLLELGKNCNVKQFILLSAICVQKPKLAFQKAKLEFEYLLMSSDIKWTIIRPTAFFKSLSGQIDRVKQGKSFIVFDGGKNTSCKPISARDLSMFIIQNINNKKSYNKILIIGGPGPAVSQFDQGQILFKLTNKKPKIRSLPSLLFRLMDLLCIPLSLISYRVSDFRESLRIGLYYATESMLKWDAKNKKYIS